MMWTPSSCLDVSLASSSSSSKPIQFHATRCETVSRDRLDMRGSHVCNASRFSFQLAHLSSRLIVGAASACCLLCGAVVVDCRRCSALLPTLDIEDRSPRIMQR